MLLLNIIIFQSISDIVVCSFPYLWAANIILNIFNYWSVLFYLTGLTRTNLEATVSDRTSESTTRLKQGLHFSLHKAPFELIRIRRLSLSYHACLISRPFEADLIHDLLRWSDASFELRADHCFTYKFTCGLQL